MGVVGKPHAVCIPYPAQGHINPMLKLAKLLHHKGFHITFVHSEFNHQRLLKSKGPHSLNGLPDFQFHTIPDCLPPSHIDATQDIPSLCVSTRENCFVPFRNLLDKLNDTASSNVPPVSCIVSDGSMTFTLKAAEELGIPEVIFWTTSACGFMGYAQYQHLIEKGLVPLKDASYLRNGYLDSVIDWVPGMKDIRLRDLPSFIRTTDPNEIMLNFAQGEVERTHKASAIIFNTFEFFERDVLDALSSMFPPIYTIGPLQLLLNQISDNGLSSIESNLWPYEPGCLEWLNSKESNSVVYVNFGSIVVMTPQQMIEFAWGLANSRQTFLWIIRPDLVTGEAAILPHEFVTETVERGKLSSWCPQEQVLKHPSIGGFLTHSGWNSTLESVCSGVPMICWPFFAEQQTNCRYTCKEWAIGMEINSDVKRDEVETLVRELMERNKGKELKKKIMEWKNRAEEATRSSEALILSTACLTSSSIPSSTVSLPPTSTLPKTYPLCVSTRKNCFVPFRNLLDKLNDTASSNVPPISCIVSDGAMTFTLKAAEELGIPEVLLWTTSACGFMGFAQSRHLIEKGLVQLKGRSQFETHLLVFGHRSRLGTWDERYSSEGIRTTDPNDIMLNFALGEVERALKASAIILNTFEILERDVLDALSSIFPPIYTIGPLQLLQNQIADKENGLRSIESNLWPYEPG
ncbi:hypothetical protein HHK36_008113 [Tetracentron sinense]|uniref:Glycosyltransferase N-terminal domain-containing protein n=1 Tax=Tetracentron sinense TaxID=13715 RepID=A0A835DJL7_TETSI|nr:hypothetical protein HHK36_008113 [Tetracentron sinense]